MKKLIIYIFVLALQPYGLAWSTVVNVPGDYPTIQQGINAGTAGDTVLVQPGTYVENINFNAHNIVLGSLFLTMGDSSYISTTIIDGDSAGTVITLNSGESAGAIIRGLTVKDGYAQNGGGIICSNGSSPQIRDNRIYHNYADDNGGGIYCTANSDPQISENVIDSNFAFNFAFGFGGGGIALFSSNPEITENVFSWNYGAGGGAIHCYESSPDIIDNEFIENSTNCDYNINGGGAIQCVVMSDPLISGNFFSGNCGISWSKGGAIYCAETSQPFIFDNQFEYNNANMGSGIACEISSDAIIIKNHFYNNTAGGGTVYSQLCDIYFSNNIVFNNTAVSGAGLYTELSAPHISGNLIFNNSASQDYASGMFSLGLWVPPTVINNVFFGNSTSGATNEIDIRYYVGPTFINNIVRNPDSNVMSVLGDSGMIVYNNIQGGWPGEGNIDVDPLFRDAANGDFHLMSTACGDQFDSPCIDAGDPSISDDSLDCLFGLGTSISDMGAYGGGCSYEAGDVNNSGAANGLDIIYLVNYLKGGPEPPKACSCQDHGMLFVSSDANGSCSVNGLDVTYMVSYFKGGPGLMFCADCPPSSW